MCRGLDLFYFYAIMLLYTITLPVLHCYTISAEGRCVHSWHGTLQVYLPMSFVYGMRGTCKETPLTAAIREELYVQDYSSIDWNAARNQCAAPDLYYPHPKVSAGL